MADAPSRAPESASTDVATPSASLLLQGWDVLFTYTTAFSRPLTAETLHRLARSTVRSGLAEVTFLSAGFLTWGTDDPHVEPFDVEVEPYVTQSQATGKFPEGLTPFQVQCALHALQQRFYEKTKLSSMALEQYSYFRAYLAPCELIIAGRATFAYLVLTVHQNGVMQASFRVLSGHDSCTVETLIEQTLRLPQTPTEDIFVPPALVRLDVQQLITERRGSRQERAAGTAEHASLVLSVQQQKKYRHRPGEDFGHTQVSLKALAKRPDPQASLTMVVSMLFNAAEALADEPQKRWRRRVTAPEQGRFWQGRPHIYIRSTVPHPEWASEFSESHTEEFGRILARSAQLSAARARAELGPSLRAADDYLTYVGRAASLSVYSASGLKSHRTPDPNDNELIYRLQANADFADYLVGSFGQCEEVALRHARTVEDLLANRERQSVLEQLVRRPFNSGELNDWLTAVMEVSDLKGTRDAIALNTTLKLEQFKEERNLRRQQFQWLMAALLGVLASASSSARSLVALIWKAGGGHPLGNLRYTLMATGLVSVLLLLAYWSFVTRLPRRKT